MVGEGFEKETQMPVKKEYFERVETGRGKMLGSIPDLGKNEGDRKEMIIILLSRALSVVVIYVSVAAARIAFGAEFFWNARSLRLY